MFNTISIIIPFYNHGDFIEECISSIPFKDKHEIIIINDGSTDENSVCKLKGISHKYPNIIILHQENSGPCKAKNIGVQYAKNPIVLFLDADNILLPNYIEDSLKVFNSYPYIDLIYSDYVCFGSSSIIHISGEIEQYKILIGNPIDNCVLIKKQIFETVGGFDENLNRLGLEDWELWINLIKNKANFYYLNKVSFKYRVVEYSRTNLQANKNVDRIKSYIYQKHCDFLAKQYHDLYYIQKQTLETPDYKIGNFLLKPFRWIKTLI